MSLSTWAVRCVAVGAVFGISSQLGIAQNVPSTDLSKYVGIQEPPRPVGEDFVRKADWKRLDALIEWLTASNALELDGRPRLQIVMDNIQGYLQTLPPDQDDALQKGLQDYRAQIPNSAFVTVLSAMRWGAQGWRALGTDETAGAPPESQKFFRDRYRRAWDVLRKERSTASRIPAWYAEAIDVGFNAEIPLSEISAIFDEGLKKNPDLLPLYFGMLRAYSPHWGGDYSDADRFIRIQTDSDRNPRGDELYARLYWSLDQWGNGDPKFFEESKVNWPRMRAGFDLMMQRYPTSLHNKSSFAAYACRAHDATTFRLSLIHI